MQEAKKGKDIQSLLDLARQHRIRYTFAERRILNRITDGGVHQGVVLEVNVVPMRTEDELEQEYQKWDNPLILALEGIQDPHNLGACLRSAAGAGVDAVLLPKSRSAPISDVVYKVSSGAVDTLFIVQVANLVRRLQWLKEQGAWIVGAAGTGKDFYADADYLSPTVLLVGGEEKGIRRLSRESCDTVVSIPLEPEIESLNVSVATGILLFEIRRQRSQPETSQNQRNDLTETES